MTAPEEHTFGPEGCTFGPAAEGMFAAWRALANLEATAVWAVVFPEIAEPDAERPFASEPGDWIPATEPGQWRFDPAVGDAEIAAWDEILHPRRAS